jgi:hypothetical protein
MYRPNESYACHDTEQFLCDLAPPSADCEMLAVICYVFLHSLSFLHEVYDMFSASTNRSNCTLEHYQQRGEHQE